MATSTPTTQNDNWLGEHGDKVPMTLKVLTILTFIWSGLTFISAFWSFAMAPANYQRMLDMQGNLDKVPSFLRGMMGDHPVETARLALDNRLPILLLTLLAAFLCFYGALYMRKLKKVGFSIYVLGDLVPFASYIFIGTDTAKGFGFIIGVCILLIFAILYATQLKYMKAK